MTQSISLLSRRSWYRRVVGRSGLTISLASVCRPSYRSHAATHSTPGNVIAVPSNPLPCMPIPIIPKRTRSLGGTGFGEAAIGSGSSRTVRAATRAPAAVPLVCRNSRREKCFVISPPIYWKSLENSIGLLRQRFHRDFFEKHNVIVAMILQAHVPFTGSSPALRLEVKLAFGNRLALRVVRDLHTIQNHRRVGAVESD